MKGKFTAVLFILIFILIAAVVFTVLSSLDNRRSTAAEPVPTAEATPAVPVTTPFAAPMNTPVPTPVVTLPPTPAPTLTPVTPQPTLPVSAPTTAPITTPVPTPVATLPTPAPITEPFAAPVQTTLSSGSFRSETGTGLNIVADWSAAALDENQVDVTVSVSAVSYMLYTQALSGSLKIALNDSYVSLDAPAIHYDGPGQAASALGTCHFTVNLPANSSGTYPLRVEWHFNGSYGGTELLVIECGGVIALSR